MVKFSQIHHPGRNPVITGFQSEKWKEETISFSVYLWCPPRVTVSEASNKEIMRLPHFSCLGICPSQFWLQTIWDRERFTSQKSFTLDLEIKCHSKCHHFGSSPKVGGTIIPRIYCVKLLARRVSKTLTQNYIFPCTSTSGFPRCLDQ